MSSYFEGLSPEDAKVLYHELAKSMHPDKGGDVAAFQDMQAEYDASLSPARIEVVSKTRTYQVVGAAVDLGPFVTYEVEYDGGHEHAILKIAKSQDDNDLMAREVRALKEIAKGVEGTRYGPYFPDVVESFRQRDTATGTIRRVLVYKRAPGLVSLAQVRAAYPDGLHPKDWAWMYRRLLIAVGAAHRFGGVVHGNLTPGNIFIQPEQHGVVIENWTHASVYDEDAEEYALIPAIDSRYRSMYAPEVLAKELPDEGTDIFTVGKLSEFALNWTITPSAITAHTRGATLAKQTMRPNDAWNLLDAYDGLIERLWGPRTFRAFTMPTTKES